MVRDGGESEPGTKQLQHAGITETVDNYGGNDRHEAREILPNGTWNLKID